MLSNNMANITLENDNVCVQSDSGSRMSDFNKNNTVNYYNFVLYIVSIKHSNHDYSLCLNLFNDMITVLNLLN